MQDKVKLACIEGYEWQKEFSHCTDILYSLDDKIDLNAFLKTISSYDIKENIIVSLLSKEYLSVGKLWLEMISRIGIKQYIIIAADNETEFFLNSLGVPNCRVTLKESDSQNNNFKSRTGFTMKGLAVTILKFPFVKKILQLGYNVLLMDIDALLLKTLPEEYFLNVDVAFQRIIYFPKPIAKVWGFAACSGFVWFRSNESTLSLIDNTIEMQQKVYCDQIALNLALWESDLNWMQADYNEPELADNEMSHRINIFKSQASQNIDGYGMKFKIKTRALAPTLFWRNDFVDFDFSKTILFHPNSPKEENGKLQVFKNYKII